MFKILKHGKAWWTSTNDYCLIFCPRKTLWIIYYPLLYLWLWYSLKWKYFQALPWKLLNLKIDTTSDGCKFLLLLIEYISFLRILDWFAVSFRHLKHGWSGLWKNEKLLVSGAIWQFMLGLSSSSASWIFVFVNFLVQRYRVCLYMLSANCRIRWLYHPGFLPTNKVIVGCCYISLPILSDSEESIHDPSFIHKHQRVVFSPKNRVLENVSITYFITSQNHKLFSPLSNDWKYLWNLRLIQMKKGRFWQEKRRLQLNISAVPLKGTLLYCRREI